MRLPKLLFLTVLAACAPVASKSGVDSRAEIDSLDARFNRWIAAGQVDSMMNVYYAPDAVLIQPGGPPVRGRDAIRAVYEGFFKAGIPSGRIQRSSIVTADSIASDVGTYQMEIRDKADKTKVIVADHGNYVTTFVRRNGAWFAIYDVTVSEVPQPPAATPGKKK